MARKKGVDLSDINPVYVLVAKDTNIPVGCMGQLQVYGTRAEARESKYDNEKVVRVRMVYE